MRYNLRDIPALEVELKGLKGEPAFDAFLSDRLGPSVGVWYDEDEDKLKVHSAWAPDEAGDLYQISEVTGPAFGKQLCKDGVIR